MPFYIKENTFNKTKCNGCVHAMIVQASSANSPSVKCTMLGMFVGPIKECNQFLPHILAPIPVHMLMNAWLLGNVEDKKSPGKTIGFKRPAVFEQMPNLIDMQKVMEDDDEEDDD